MADERHGRRKSRETRPPWASRARIAGGALLVVAVAAALLALASSGESSQPAAPDVPVGTIPTSGDTWTEYPLGNSPGVHILHVGSDAGYVLAGGEARVCAHVVNGAGENLEGADVSFSALEGDFVPASASTGIDGSACSTFLAPPASGSVVITVRATRFDLGTDEAQKTVEVVGNEPGPALAPVPAGIALVAAATGTSLLAVAPAKEFSGRAFLKWQGRLVLGSFWLAAGAALTLAAVSSASAPVGEHVHVQVEAPVENPYAVPAMVLGLIGALLIASGFPHAVRNRRAPRLRAAKLAVLLVLLADGVIHLYASADHAAVPVFAAFFFAVGLGQVAVPSLVARRTGLLVWFGLWASAGLIALFAYTRIYPPPFHDDPEPVEALGIVSKALEVLTVVILVYIFLRARSLRLRSRRAQSPSPATKTSEDSPMSSS